MNIHNDDSNIVGLDAMCMLLLQVVATCVCPGDFITANSAAMTDYQSIHNM